MGGFGLDGIVEACRAFDNPQDSFKSIHVAGTNGKGSVTSFLSQILIEAGFRVGKSTSPHLVRVNERISLNEVSITDGQLEDVLGRIRAHIEEGGITLSFFETMTLAAFLHFRDEGVDYAVFEVGLGGRLDATNVLAKPEATVITSIGLDHQLILGDTIKEIAAEKAGIAKPGVALFLGTLGIEVDSEATKTIKSCASAVGAPVIQLGVDASVAMEPDPHLSLSQDSIFLAPKLQGSHQIRNAGLSALVAYSIGISREKIERGIAATFWPGRLERIDAADRSFLIDCAHNIDGFRVVADYLRSSPRRVPVTVVIGFLKTKNWRQMLEIIDEFACEYIIARPDSNMAEEVEVVAEYAHAFGKLTSVHDSSYDALADLLLSESYQGKSLLLIGSIYLVAHLRDKVSSRV
ncbi:MAG: bifunctional folylpolyglutamate synthase/dihydrofolate synthase [Bdellovibrionales bacterium]|nr:bifunctional folylpolyglutamate synthase/dihydrofolate synthase [Bdellovibrionales bacterium]